MSQAEALKNVLSSIKTATAAKNVICMLLIRFGPEICKEVSEFAETLKLELEGRGDTTLGRG
jgi:hypothetical protein